MPAESMTLERIDIRPSLPEVQELAAEGEYSCGKPYKKGDIPTDEELIVESMKPADG